MPCLLLLSRRTRLVIHNNPPKVAHVRAAPKFLVVKPHLRALPVIAAGGTKPRPAISDCTWATEASTHEKKEPTGAAVSRCIVGKQQTDNGPCDVATGVINAFVTRFPTAGHTNTCITANVTTVAPF